MVKNPKDNFSFLLLSLLRWLCYLCLEDGSHLKRFRLWAPEQRGRARDANLVQTVLWQLNTQIGMLHFWKCEKALDTVRECRSLWPYDHDMSRVSLPQMRHPLQGL